MQLFFYLSLDSSVLSLLSENLWKFSIIAGPKIVRLRLVTKTLKYSGPEGQGTVTSQNKKFSENTATFQIKKEKKEKTLVLKPCLLTLQSKSNNINYLHLIRLYIT